MKTANLIRTLLPLLILAFVITSCEKVNDKSPTMDTVEDDVISELIYEDIFAEVESAMNEMESIIYDGIKKSASVETCKIITVEQPEDSVFWPRTITIDYGDGCTGPNGVVRKGKIIIVVSKGKFWLRDYSRTVTFEGYYVDDRKIEGTKVVTHNGRNEAGNIVFSEILSGGKVILPDGKEITREFEREREWVAGFNTPRMRFDDEYMVTGIASGVDRKGRTYTRTIIAPLHIKLSCRWIVAGTIEIQVDELPEAILDYGDGRCDRKATVTVDGVTKDIILQR